MAISWYVVEAHEQAYWSVAGSSLRAAMPAGSSLRDLRVRGAVSRVEALARPADRVEMLDALDRVVNRTAGRSRYGEVHARAQLLIRTAEPELEKLDNNVRYFRDAAAAFERLGVAAAAIEALRSAIAAEQGLEDYDGDLLLQQHVPELFEQWSSQPDPAARGRVTDRIETVMELLYVADGRDLTDEDDSALYAYELAQSGEDQQVIAREVQRYRAELMRSYDRALDESNTARTQAAQLNQPLTPDELAGRPAVTPPWTATATPQPYGPSGSSALS